PQAAARPAAESRRRTGQDRGGPKTAASWVNARRRTAHRQRQGRAQPIQRRHQKIVEETPSPAVNPALRQKMGLAAVAAARASGYVNAGTVEFILGPDGDFYFLEVNTRLQVEHPITEMVAGIDIVRQQICIAAGHGLKIDQADITGRGHAIECRIYAEDPQDNFMPCPGRIVLHEEPSGPGVRNDCGVYAGFEIPMDYDPILSKLVVWAESRPEAIARMIRALETYTIAGVKTSIAFLIDVLSAPPFERGETFTDFIPAHFGDWKPGSRNDDWAAIAWVADSLMVKQRPTTGVSARQMHPSPWTSLGAWRQ
ncbi:MAG: hypothetical protein EOM10_18330, partial [Opitutae bacterium]|nr:hypothetical protein [Opitutae bacterium]